MDMIKNLLLKSDPNIDALLSGRHSGDFSEWSALREEVRMTIHQLIDTTIRERVLIAALEQYANNENWQKNICILGPNLAVKILKSVEVELLSSEEAISLWLKKENI